MHLQSVYQQRLLICILIALCPQIVRDQCWINETLKTLDWVAEDLMPDIEGDEDDMDIAGAPEEDLEALYKGKHCSLSDFFF